MEAKLQPSSASRTRTAVLQSRRKNLFKLRKSLPVLTASFELKNFQSHECQPTTKEIDEKIEQKVQDWIEGQYPIKVSSTAVREKARQIYREHGRSEIECSYGWYRRFKMRMVKKGTRGGGLPAKLHEEEDSIVLTWLLKEYDNNQVVSYRELQSYAQGALRQMKSDFKASPGWALRFLKRNHLLVNWNEGLYPNMLPTHLESKVSQFRKEVSFKFNQYPTALVGCMDEIPLSFSSPITSGQKTGDGDDGVDAEWEYCGKVSRLRKLSVKNCDATLVLGMMANGELLNPMVIVKGQLHSSLNQAYNMPHSSVVAYYSNSTEPTTVCLEKWIELVWSKAVKTSDSVIILDSYEMHSSLVERFQVCKTTCLQIPSGCSLKLQPLNTLAKGLFMKNLENLWLDFLKSSDDDTDGSCFQNMKLPTTNEIVEWVQKAFEITSTFQKELCNSFSQILQ